jgi:hypothetical protein
MSNPFLRVRLTRCKASVCLWDVLLAAGSDLPDGRVWALSQMKREEIVVSTEAQQSYWEELNWIRKGQCGCGSCITTWVTISAADTVVFLAAVVSPVRLREILSFSSGFWELLSQCRGLPFNVEQAKKDILSQNCVFTRHWNCNMYVHERGIFDAKKLSVMSLRETFQTPEHYECVSSQHTHANEEGTLLAIEDGPRYRTVHSWVLGGQEGIDMNLPKRRRFN